MVQARVSRLGEAIVFAVEDSGHGIALADLPHIFDRFYRGQGRRVDGHAGLGLALVREIVERHGGVVHVESWLGEGTCFSLTLPIEASTSASVEAVHGLERTA